MDIQHLVDRLEDLIGEGRRLPFSEQTLINEKRALAVIDQMRSSVPEEVDRANKLLQQRDQVLMKANEEAGRILDQAREAAEKLVSRDAIVQQAQERAARIIEEARADIEKTKRDADEYVAEVLTQLETQLLKPLSQVRNGLSKLNAEREAQRQRAEAARQIPAIPAAVEPPKADPAPAAPPPPAASVNAPAPAMRIPADPKPISKPVPKAEVKAMPPEPRSVERRVEQPVDSE